MKFKKLLVIFIIFATLIISGCKKHNYLEIEDIKIPINFEYKTLSIPSDYFGHNFGQKYILLYPKDFSGDLTLKDIKGLYFINSGKNILFVTYFFDNQQKLSEYNKKNLEILKQKYFITDIKTLNINSKCISGIENYFYTDLGYNRKIFFLNLLLLKNNKIMNINFSTLDENLAQNIENNIKNITCKS